MKIKISAILIVKNEEKMIANALKTVGWCDEIIVIDNNSIDQTKNIAQKFTNKIFSSSEVSFSKLRQLASQKASGDYLFYLDADERVTRKLKEEIIGILENKKKINLKIRRKNMFYGRYFYFGNWQKDWVLRFFAKQNLLSWSGDIHETPNVTGETTMLVQELIHFTHRNTKENTLKSASWTLMEAQLLASQSAKVTRLMILRKGIMEFWRRFFYYRGYKDGMEGFIESLVQGMNKFLIYIQIWELQQKMSLEEKYLKEDQKILAQWEDN